MKQEVIKQFRVYKDGENISYGLATIQTPALDGQTTEIKGAGILGSYNVPNIGHFGAMETTINFFAATEETKSLYPGKYILLDLRIAEQYHDESTNEKSVTPSKYLIGGTVTKVDFGKVEGGTGADGSIAIDTLIFGSWIDGKEIQYLDKLNYVYRVNGTDIMEAERTALGG